MNKQDTRQTVASLLAWFAAGASGFLLPGCSETQVARNEPAPPVVRTVSSAQPTEPPVHSASTSSMDFAAMELMPVAPVFTNPNRDPVVGNPDNPPSTYAPAGAKLPGMALDVMESLAQVTFAKQGSDFDPSLSHDGKHIVFASTQHRTTADIYIKTVNGRTITQLTADPGQDVMPAISPDGQRVAFSSNRTGSWDIYVMSVTGGQAVQVTNDPAQELHASWSADGSKLVYSRLGQVSGRWEMWVTDIDQPMAAEFIGYGLFPSWCPTAGTGDNGRDKIVYQRSRERGDRAFSVWTVDYKPGDASSPTEVASHPTAACINPSWSPDGRWIVFASVPFVPTHPSIIGAGRPTVADLWMCCVDGSGRVNLTTGRSVNLMPSWGADSRIYFVSDRGGIENIWSIGTEKALLAATGGRSNPTDTARATTHGATAEVTDASENTTETPGH